MSKNGKSVPLYDQAYMQIRQGIMAGKYQPGEHLTDIRLADELNISRTPVREALKQLIREGLLNNEHNKGVTVFDPTLEDIAEIYAFRASLEGMAAALAAVNERRKDYLYYMMEQLDISREAEQQGDIRQLTDSNMRFHDLILQSSGSARLKSLLEPLRSKSFLIRYSSLSNKQHSKVSLEEHGQIFEKIRRGEANAAESYMKQHILSAGQRVLERLTADLQSKEERELPVAVRFFHQYVGSVVDSPSTANQSANDQSAEKGDADV